MAAASGNGGNRASGPRCIALVGPFQSGKTTLLEAILSRTGAIARQGTVEAGTIEPKPGVPPGSAHLASLVTAMKDGGVTAVIILIWIAALLNIALGIWMLLAWIGDNPAITDAQGNAITIPTFYLIINGLLSLLLGVMYVWLARLAGIGSQHPNKDMFVAAFKVHLGAGFFWTSGGYEYPLMWGLVALAFVLQGGGRYSLDALIFRTR